MLTRPFLRRKTFCTERIPMTPPGSGYYTLASGKDLGIFKPLNR